MMFDNGFHTCFLIVRCILISSSFSPVQLVCWTVTLS